jgi:DUF4097 and DUF4098 domain-containing protein YvlB
MSTSDQKRETIMKRSLLVLAMGVALSCTACAGGSDTDKVNGSISVSAGQPATDVSTVNGGVRIADNAQVKSANTVNGGITLGDGAQAAELDTVNGSITLGAKAAVSGTVETVNGGIRLANGADIKGKLSNVNGDINLDSAHIGGGIETTAADITINGSSKVEGGIHVQKPSGMNFGGSNKVPKIVIGPGATVTGALDFEREVELHVSDRATIGSVRGATVQKFSGDTP